MKSPYIMVQLFIEALDWIENWIHEVWQEFRKKGKKLIPTLKISNFDAIKAVESSCENCFYHVEDNIHCSDCNNLER
jgi:hypothetical protein